MARSRVERAACPHLRTNQGLLAPCIIAIDPERVNGCDAEQTGMRDEASAAARGSTCSRNKGSAPHCLHVGLGIITAQAARSEPETARAIQQAYGRAGSNASRRERREAQEREWRRRNAKRADTNISRSRRIVMKGGKTLDNEQIQYSPLSVCFANDEAHVSRKMRGRAGYQDKTSSAEIEARRRDGLDFDAGGGRLESSGRRERA
ncbi:hypothetical protein C8R44DRAFT_750345 [Mycena epipterygia]|nr:hypothetical protein C8R44DRAFT_750345 [Mycena epipterygia]